MSLNRSRTQVKDPVNAYQFLVCIGNQEYGFSKISGLRRERENFMIQEGGLNDRVHILPGPAKTGGTIRLERGVYTGEFLPFYMVGERIGNSMTVELWDDPLKRKGKKKIYRLTGLVVKAWEAGDLDAGQNQILIDRLELDYGFLQIEIN